MKSPVQILKENIGKNETVILGVSGGPDSVYLLNLCHKFAKKNRLKIVVAHVNHRLRGKASDEDETFVRSLCKKKKIGFELKKLGKISGNLEEGSRNARYAFFEKLRRKYGAKWIITAHHHGDNVETVLYNLVRGSFLSGMKGMDFISRDRHLLRPLLNLTKDEILAFLHNEKISYCIDQSNLDTRFSRNLLRHKVIPLFREINPDFNRTFGENLFNIKEVMDYLQTWCEKWLMQNQGNEGILLSDFLDLPPFMQKSVLAELYRRTNGDIKKFNRSHLEQILGILRSKKAGMKKEFGGKYFITVEKTAGSGPRFINIKKPVWLKKNQKSLK